MFIFPFVSQIQTLLLPLLPLLPLLLHLSTSSSLLCYCCSFFSVITQRQLRGKQGRETFLTGANAKATERYWRYVFEYVPDQHIAPMDMKPLLNVRETHLDIVLTPPGAKYQLGGVPPANKHENNYEEEQEERKERKEQEARPEEGSASAGGSSSGGRSPEGAKKMKMNNKNNKNKNKNHVHAPSSTRHRIDKWYDASKNTVLLGSLSKHMIIVIRLWLGSPWCSPRVRTWCS